MTNPAARTDPGAPISGMPILDADQSRSVVVLKRSMNLGFAGIDNELYHPKTSTLLGDAKSSVNDITEGAQGPVAARLEVVAGRP